MFSLVYFVTKFGYRLLLSLSAKLENVEKSWTKGPSALCIKVASDPVTFLITMITFRFLCKKLPFDPFNLNLY